MLKHVKASLSKLTHVNKKAADQYISFTEQKQEMGRRHRALIQSSNILALLALHHFQPGEENIKNLMRYLDMQKDEAIERTFKGVARHFKETFSELVPGGSAELVMQKRIMEDDEEDLDMSLDENRRGSQSLLDIYSGVKVKVREIWSTCFSCRCVTVRCALVMEEKQCLSSSSLADRRLSWR